MCVVPQTTNESLHVLLDSPHAAWCLQVINPSGRDKNIPKPVGPATEQQALLRKYVKFTLQMHV
eukprot:1159744-Pelagomonas_calceolata.AAC.3